MDVAIFPTINASLNFLAGVFLLLGWSAIRKNQRLVHQRYMMAALISSALFLLCYVTYHALKQGVVTRYQGTGVMRAIYFFILGTHTPLAMIIVPFCVMAIIHAFKGRYEKHTQITRWLMPTWLYVSVTGVLIYLMLYVWK